MSAENDSDAAESIESEKKIKKGNNKNKNKIILNISDCQYPVVSRVAKKLGWKLQSATETMDWDVCWTDNAVQAETLLKMEPHQKINHFPGMFNLARKNLMGRNLMKMRKRFVDDYSFFPLTWMLPIEYHELKAYFDCKQKGKARTFIVKPEAMSQGKGIFLTRKIEDIDPSSHCVVQRYLHKPYLIEGLKFDLRVYVLVAGVSPLRLYIYEEGLTRFATEKYEPPTKDNMEDVCMHLTNYAINKDNPKFVFNNSSSDMSKGHKRSLTWLYEYLENNDPRGSDLKIKIEDMIVKTMISGLPAISNTYRSCQPENYASNMCFELLGFDVMLTEKCEPILIEINHTPSFSTDTPLDNTIKTNYIRDSLIIMNINEKTKESIIKERREACQQRVITGKKVKLTVEEKEYEKKKAHKEREKYESKNVGGFKKIFPIEDEAKMQKYEEFILFSQQKYEDSTGNKKIANSKKSEKIESAFGTCFKPKDNIKTFSNFKNKTTTFDLCKNTAVNGTERKKILHKNVDTYEQNQKNQLKTQSENSIDQNLEISSSERIPKDGFLEFDSVNEKSKTEMGMRSSSTLEGLKTDENAESVTFVEPIANQMTSDHLENFSHFKRSSDCTKDLVNKNESYEKSELYADKRSFEMKSQISKTYKGLSPKSKESKELWKMNVNNFEALAEYEGSNFEIKKSQRKNKTTYAQNPNTRSDQLKLGIFGVNQITTETERKKEKSSNPKSMTYIQHSEYRNAKQSVPREKVPILLNTLLIGNFEEKPQFSAQNLRKTVTNPSIK